MTTVNYNGQVIKFPDGMSHDEIKAVLRDKAPSSQPKSQPKTDVNPIAGTARAGLQGMTFGMSDELGAATAAIFGALKTGESYSDVYDKMHQGLQNKREQFSQDHPGIALGAEVAGGLATGGMGANRVLGNQAFKQATNAGKIGRLSGVGAAEGAVYGAGAADQGNRLSGAATGGLTGAVAAPLGAGAVNAIGKGIGGMATYAGRKLTDSPTAQARRAMQTAADSEGLTGAQIADKVSGMGGQGTILDTGESFRSLARAGMDKSGPMKSQGRSLVDTRQKTQQARLMNTIEKVTGKKAGAYKQTLNNVVKERQAASKPLYDEAFQTGVKQTPELKRFVRDPHFAKAIKKGQKYAKTEGKGTETLRVLNYALESLGDDIGAAVRKGKGNHARILIGLKNSIVDEIGKQNKPYLKAREMFSGHSSAKDALENGHMLFKKSFDDMDDYVKGLNPSELEMFRMGGVKALGDRLDKVADNSDSVKALLKNADLRNKLGLIFDDPTEFLKRAGVESEFTASRQAVTGGPNTAERLAMQKALDNDVDPGPIAAMASPSGAVGAIIKAVTKGEATPEMIQKLGDMMLTQGMPRDEILRIFKSPMLKKSLGTRYDEIVSPIIRGGMAPVAVGMN